MNACVPWPQGILSKLSAAKEMMKVRRHARMHACMRELAVCSRSGLRDVAPSLRACMRERPQNGHRGPSICCAACACTHSNKLAARLVSLALPCTHVARQMASAMRHAGREHRAQKLPLCGPACAGVFGTRAPEAGRA